MNIANSAPNGLVQRKADTESIQKYLPFAFTEQGVAMLSSVLKSRQAILVNIQIMRVFVKMRQMISSYNDLLEKIEKLEATSSNHSTQIRAIYDLIKELLEPSIKDRPQIGFKISSTDKKSEH
jgi:hypothetical protein